MARDKVDLSGYGALTKPPCVTLLKTFFLWYFNKSPPPKHQHRVQLGDPIPQAPKESPTGEPTPKQHHEAQLVTLPPSTTVQPMW